MHLIKGPEKPKWSRVISNDIGQIFQGIIDIEGKDVCLFILRHEVTQDIKVSYCRIIYEIIPHKKETHRVIITVGGYKLTYYGPVSNP